MELKQAMEAATADLDVRPGFVGDVMAGARRRQTRKLVAVTAAVALLAGVVTGVVLTRSSTLPPDSGDHRLTAAPAGDLAGDADFVSRALATWNNGPEQSWRQAGQVKDLSAEANVFWAGTTPEGPAALVAQAVRLDGQSESRTVVGLVSGGNVVDREIDFGRESGLFQLGKERSTHIVQTLGSRVFWSVNPVRGGDGRLTRAWQEATGPGGVAVVSAKQSDRPVFVRGDTAPAPDDFTREPLTAREDKRPDNAFYPHPGLGWKGRLLAADLPEGAPLTPPARALSPDQELREKAFLDYAVGWNDIGAWMAHAWLPDGRHAEVIESLGELYGLIHRPDGEFSAAVLGGPVSAVEPMLVPLPDGQGTFVIRYGTRIGPDERPDAWLAPAGTTEVTVWEGDTPKVVPLP
ncbi:hypothetical protein SAMN05216553_104466 [Lentzea fradiae]|uniref:Uncharacterized protein n=1 Tax=Lentzea fradiae TaxID=200378 RepID=A0A1G7QIF7_9PSEU|nr:hypothetical protein [Lentzea fradiae]SDF98347.1 hypothetical protein SAMN05216553_104466 [Lentzea fradiae]